MENNKINIIILIILSAFCANSQVLVSHKKTPQELVNKVLLSTNSGIKVQKIKYIGSKEAIAEFVTKTKLMPIKQGIILSTGKAKDADGPNDSSGSGEAVFTDGNNIFKPYATGETWDAAILEIDFYANTDTVSFEYIFASEEYPEFVNKGVNDVFVFLIGEKNTQNFKNIALVPNTSLPVSVDNLNKHTNNQWFIENISWDTYKKGNYNTADFQDINAQLELSYTFQYDGLTTLLKATANVKPYQLYTLKIGIADVGDNLYDSGVFIKNKSFKSSGNILPLNTLIEKEATMLNKDSNLFIFDKSNNSLNLLIHFGFDAYEITSESFFYLKKVAHLINTYFDRKVEIIGYTDETGSNDYNQKLSERRAKAVYDFLIKEGVNSQQISWKGKGKGKASPLIIDENKKSKQNRRVEFVFY